ncbi:hypothetical protein PYW07_006141 [Mythimna separata]|uniref:Glutathione S-transferase n=1 Tax=Mythimna separata TaxID=271217 RepID=A0A9E9JWH3_MYTSE|nr:hypothetical protein PYW07_006141 [Mythimna separata]WAS27864.1 glutathione S-transferase [Mythimna separata]
MPLKIYKTDASPPVRAVMMTTELIKLKIDVQEVNIFTGANKTPEYLEKNPLHSVPLLEDGDFVLSDSHAIITYLVSKYGAEKRSTLYPNELSVRAIIDSRLYFDTSILFPNIRAIIKAILADGIKEVTPKQIEDVNAAYEILDKYLQKTKFVAGDNLTVADVSCVASISSLDVLVPVDDKYEKLKAWWSSLQEEEWYQEGNLPGLAQYEGLVKSMLN